MNKDLRTSCEAVIKSCFSPPVQYGWEFQQDADDANVYWLRREPTALASPRSAERAARICVALKPRIRPSDIPFLFADRAETCEQRMVFTEYATPSVADKLEAEDIWHADVQGNVRIWTEGLWIDRRGNRPASAPAPRGQYFSAPGAKVLHYLLKTGPRVQATYRAIREVTGVSIDKIGKVVRELERDQVVRVHGAGDYEVVAGDRLQEQWVAAYAARLAPRLLLGRYVARGNPEPEELAARAMRGLGEDVLIGGEVAGARLTGYLRPADLRLYLPEAYVPEARTLLELAPSKQGDIEICLRYGDVLVGAATSDGAQLVDPAFVYAELMGQEDDRLAETAARIRQDLLQWTL